MMARDAATMKEHTPHRLVRATRSSRHGSAVSARKQYHCTDAEPLWHAQKPRGSHRMTNKSIRAHLLPLCDAACV